MNRAEFCKRLMPALRLVAKQGHIRNDARTRELLGYDVGTDGCRQFGNRLCDWARQGLLLSATTSAGLRRFYRLSVRGQLALDTNGRHAHGHAVSSRLEAYVAANPDEELTVDDVAVKFSCSRWQARRAVDYLVHKGAVEHVKVVRAVQRPRNAERRAA